MILDATSAAKSGQKSTFSSPLEANIGVGRGDISDLFGKLRKHSRKMRWTSEVDEELDRKKEEMDMCETDHQLLESEPQIFVRAEQQRGTTQQHSP
jgi:hypothetical protein